MRARVCGSVQALLEYAMPETGEGSGNTDHNLDSRAAHLGGHSVLEDQSRPGQR